MTDEQSAEEQLAGPGTLLKNARVEKGLSQEDVASRLNLRLTNVQDLEEERFDKAISVTFIRGYLKAYAKLLELPVESVLEAYERVNTVTPEPAKLQSFSRKMSLQANDDRLMMVSYLILAVILALVVVWWFQQSDSDILPEVSTPIESTQPESQSVSDFSVQEQQDEPLEQTPQLAQTSSEQAPESGPDNSGAQENGALTSQGQDTTTQSADAGDVATEQGAAPEETTTPEETASAQPQPPANEMLDAVELVFEFSDDCWVNIVDATGEAIAYGVKVQGRVMPVSGIPPFEVTLGAPEVVSITYAGEAVDMSRFASGRTARFNLPLSQ
ncbi:RodZ domain-containing protein [Lacimicrobium sp. SS2-24]|uniref:RodZ domain-containing protein n=1 Tax=Lacimicrobium sp. SS2-24 TaxID=2005569 RepID=UPI000B4A9254|nr:RodZ domain-containing protein [Lacimicrobium sp. SS2-24]